MIIIFQSDFNSFIENVYTKEDFNFYARPNQNLSTHIENMIREALSYFCHLPPFTSPYAPYLYLGTFVAILCHDFGKLLPHFQYKIYRRANDDSNLTSLPQNQIPFSYHSLASACFAEVVCDTLFEHIKEQSDEKQEPDLIKPEIFKYLVIESIISHHAPNLLIDYFEVIDEPFSNKTEQLKQYFKYFTSLSWEKVNSTIFRLFTNNQGIENLRHENTFLDPKSSTFIISKHTLTQTLIQATKDFFLNYLKETDDFLTPSIPEKVNHLKQLRLYFQTYLDKSNSRFSIDLYVVQNFIASLLCDLDIWDARFYNPTTHNHHIRFFTSLPPLNPQLVENYVSAPFGTIKENYQNYTPNPCSSVIDSFRRALFEETNAYPFEMVGLFELNSPTGAGKTLSLLNLAFKATDTMYYQKYRYTPKIIYSLPFVSIGTQVAEQIQDLFQKSKKSPNSELLTIDNYTTEAIWDYGDHNSEQETIYGKDAKWLISTWRSQFTVTTFVKIFHTLLKPKKANYLRFHRISHSILIFDEIQCLPIKYWKNCQILDSLSRILNCTVFLSTATLPALLTNTQKRSLAPTHLQKSYSKKPNKHENQSTISQALNRYTIQYYPKRLKLYDFLETLSKHIKNNKTNILIVLNTKNAAMKTYQYLEKNRGLLDNPSLYLLSTLVLPIDRKKNISEIKSLLNNSKAPGVKNETKNQLIVIATQVVEAGVDLTFKYVFRDLAPMDSIVQVAGRCNRGYEYDEGKLYLFELTTEENKTYFNYVYKTNGAASITKEFLKNATDKKSEDLFGTHCIIPEFKLRTQFKEYFQKIKHKNNHKLLYQDLIHHNYVTLARHFNIIESYPNQIPVFLVADKTAETLHKRWKKGYSLTSTFYLYTILLPKSVVLSLEGQDILKVVKKRHEVLYYYLPKQHLQNYYTSTSGFIYDYDNLSS